MSLRHDAPLSITGGSAIGLSATDAEVEVEGPQPVMFTVWRFFGAPSVQNWTL